MGSYKHIEKCIAGFIALHYCCPVEVGIGINTFAAIRLRDAGLYVRCTDIRPPKDADDLLFFLDDVFAPDLSRYEGADLIYSIRPAIEMLPPLLALAQKIGCDLLVYHLGFEVWCNGGAVIDCGVTLHCYYRASEPVKKG